MKKTFLLSVFSLLLSINAQADQLAYLSEAAAKDAVSFLRNHKEVILFCGCCEGKQSKTKILITEIYFEHTGMEDYYQVIIEGKDEKGNMVKEFVDLAYLFVPQDKVAINVGLSLGLDCNPCTPPFEI